LGTLRRDGRESAGATGSAAADSEAETAAGATRACLDARGAVRSFSAAMRISRRDVYCTGTSPSTASAETTTGITEIRGVAAPVAESPSDESGVFSLSTGVYLQGVKSAPVWEEKTLGCQRATHRCYATCAELSRQAHETVTVGGYDPTGTVPISEDRSSSMWTDVARIPAMAGIQFCGGVVTTIT
jgi:hypothetical protein